MKDELAKRFGKEAIRTVTNQENDASLLSIQTEIEGKNITILMTDGLRNYKMPVAEKWKGREYNELYFCLPSYWDLSEMQNPKFNWVFDWLRKLVNHVKEKETWFGHGHTVYCKSSLSPTMKQEYLLFSDPIFLKNQLSPIEENDKIIHFLSVIPIFKKELDYKQSKGMFKFEKKMLDNNITEILDDFRGSALKRWWFFKR